MSRSTLTKRQTPRPTIENDDAPLLDLGALTLPRGTVVTAKTVDGKTLVGSLLDVDYRDGLAYTATLYAVDGARRSSRHVYADTVRPL